LSAGERQRLRLLLSVSITILLGLVGLGVVTEHSARTALVQVGQMAPDFSLPATSGENESLAKARGHPVVLAFVPSVLCEFCQEQLDQLNQAAPALRERGVLIMAISTDTPAVQRTVAGQVDLRYPILSEAPIAGQHPVGSAYGVYHLPQRHPGPVDANAIIIIDETGIVRAVQVQPARPLSESRILALVDEALGPRVGR
jgi:peroxiredoxin Q/BCP